MGQGFSLFFPSPGKPIPVSEGKGAPSQRHLEGARAVALLT